jgi:hypothetical protein
MTYKVLSIDLDYIMGPTIETYSNVLFDEDPMTRWKHLYEYTQFRESQFYADTSSVIYCYDVFLKSLKNCSNVGFGYEHDEILYELQSHKDIDLINIDHHDDIFGGDYTRDKDLENPYQVEYDQIIHFNRVHEGNWGAWLQSKDKLNSFTWIGNENSKNKIRNEINKSLIQNYSNVEKTNYTFDDYNFDHIFVCLSPQYTPKQHWHYFSMFITAFETMKGRDAIIHTDKYETTVRHQLVHNEILHQRSNGR